MEEHRERKEAEPLTLSKGAVKCVLKSCGVSDSHVEEFALRYDDAFGADMALSPRNLVEKQIEVCTPDVVIKVSPERSDLVDTRVIDGSSTSSSAPTRAWRSMASRFISRNSGTPRASLGGAGRLVSAQISPAAFLGALANSSPWTMYLDTDL